MDLLLSISLFLGAGAGFVLFNLLLSALIRPKLPNPEKSDVYECGEPAEGSSWVQFDLRFYIVALVFLVFDVEVALLYPWAVAWGDAAGNLATVSATRLVAFVDLLIFLGILLVGFAFLWRFGYLEWVRSVANRSLKRRG